MGRPVLLSFAGAAEIPIVPYQKTQDHEAEVLGIPGIDAIPGLAGFPGLAEGEVTQWRKEPGASTSGNVNPLLEGAIEPGRMSFYLLDNISSGKRWYSGSSNTEWHNFADGFSDVEISVLDTFGMNREVELLAIPQGVSFYIYHLEISPNDLTFRWKVTPTGIPLLIPYTGSNPLDANFVHYTVDAKLEAYNGVGWDEVTLDVNALYNGVGIFKAPGASANTDPQAQWEPLVWGVSGIGGSQLAVRIDEVRTYETTSQSISEGVVAAGEYAIDDRRLTYHWDTQTAGNRTAFLEVGDRIRLPDTVDIDLDITVSIQAYAGLTLIWGGDVRARAERPGEIELHVISVQAIEPPPGGGTGHMWEDVVSFTIEWARFVIPDPSPAVPPFGGTPGTPAVPPVPGIPAVPGIYEGAMYGRPAIPPFGIWGERLTMTMTHRVENELEVIDLQISGHDYIIRQEWVTPKDHRVRPFCWMQDERGIVQTVETVDQSDEKITRFSTMAIVNGPANATAVPLPADFEEGDSIAEPSFRVQPEVVNHVLVVHDDIDPQPESIIMEVQVRVGWALTSFAVEKVLTRDDNHPADGALLTTIDTPFRTPPYPPALATEGSLYLHIWVSGLIDPLSFLLGGANQISGWTKIGRLVVDGVSGALYVSDHLLSEAINQFDFEVRLTNA